MNGLFLVESPFQLLCAYEAMSAYALQHSTIVVRFSRKKKNDDQLKKLIDLLFEQDQLPSIITIAAENRRFMDYMKLFFLCMYVALRMVMFQYVFIGNAESGVLKLATLPVSKRKIVLLDDGIKSFLIQERSSAETNYNMFTMLYGVVPFQCQEICVNDFSVLKNKILNSSTIVDDQILFIGTDISEYGMMSEGEYVAAVKAVVDACKASKVVYVPHRLECECKLLKLKQVPGMELKRTDYPVELYSFYNQEVPKTIYSFYSGALISLHCIYGETITVRGLIFDYSQSEYQSDIDRIYTLMGQYVTVEEVPIAT